MHKTLKRPLFKQKAMEAYKAKHGGKVPGYYLGAQIAYQGIRSALAPAFRYLGPKVSAFMARPGVQTGLTGLEAYGVGYGAGEMAEGYRTGDYGKMIEGAAYAVPGAAFLPQTAKRSGIAALRETGEYLTPRATELQKAIVRNPKATAGISFGSAVGGSMLSDDAGATLPAPEGMTQEEYDKDVQERLVFSKPQFSTEIVSEEQVPQVTKQPRLQGIQDPKTQGEQLLNTQIKEANAINDVAEKLGVDLSKATDKQIKQIAIETNIDLPKVKSYLPEQKTTTPIPMGDGTPPQNVQNLGEAELNYLVQKRQKDLAAAKELSESDLATGFKQFKNELTKITGSNNENFNNLMAMRVASKLLTGKTRESGSRGFLDITGQALDAYAQDALALGLKQRDFDLELAKAYLQMRSKKTAGPKIQASGDRTVRVTDPSVPGGFRNVRLAYDENSGQYLERKFSPERGQYFEVAQFTGTDIKRNDEKLNKALMNLEENRRGGKMIEFVIDNATQGGAKAAFGLLREDVIGTLDFFGGADLGADSSTVDDLIKTEMQKNVDKRFFGLGADKGTKLQEQFAEDLQNARENGAKEVEKQLKKAGVIGKNYRPTQEELKTYTKLALIEQRMKYIVANANKSEDRLTQKDIDNAAKRTQIIKYISSPRTIELNYQALRNEFDEKASSFLTQYKLNGGEEQFILDNFMDIPGVQRAYEKRAEGFEAREAAKNKVSRKEVLDTIPIYGVQ